MPRTRTEAKSHRGTVVVVRGGANAGTQVVVGRRARAATHREGAAVELAWSRACSQVNGRGPEAAAHVHAVDVAVDVVVEAAAHHVGLRRVLLLLQLHLCVHVTLRGCAARPGV
jgi:hypothetical protein